MACEFLGTEYTPDKRLKSALMHERHFCTANGEGCLVDDPLGFPNCTRRAFLLLSKAQPDAKPQPKPRKHNNKRGVDASQYALL
jgi:hypothetical protein